MLFGTTAPPLAPAVVEPDLDAEVDKILNCTVIIKVIDGARGNGIAVTRTKVLTSLHGLFNQGDAFNIIDCHGTIRRGSVLRSRFSSRIVDIAVLELNEGTPPFESFVPIYVREMLNLSGPICTSIFRTAYFSEAGMLGCAVVTTRIGTSHALVGVHLGSHDKTTPVRLKKKKGKSKGSNVTTEEFDDAMMSVNSDIHGHGAYSLICEACRVEGLLALIAPEI
eukprot:gene28311-34183_t